MVYFIFTLIIGGLLYFFKKREEMLEERVLNLLISIRDRKKYVSDKIPEILKVEYEDTITNVINRDLELDKSLEELNDYKSELEITYNSLIKKSKQLEYTNQILERKVENLSNLNAISRMVLSSLDLENIITIIFDAYFILTGAKRISLYLWENGNLINKRTKGDFKFTSNVYYENEVVSNFEREDYQLEYEKISNKFILSKDEIIIISPMIVKGKELGVIYIIEDKNIMIELDKETISALVIQVSIAINNAQVYSELLIKERISKELDVASRIQKKILPNDLNRIAGLEIAQYFEPAKEIGGDYYDYTILNENMLSITIADVSGKGVPAAFLMALSRAVLKTLTVTGKFLPEENLKELNQVIYPDIDENMFITMMHCKYNKENKTLCFSNAGHTPIIVYHSKTDTVELHTVKGVALGFIENYQYKRGEIKLEQGDIVLFYTDGITEAKSVDEKMFGIEKLKNLLYLNKNKSSNNIKEKILEEISQFTTNHEQIDDLTFVILKIM